MCVSKPSRNFGSNQVLFGGITFPLSAIAKSCSSVTGYKLNAAAISPLFTLFSNSSRPRMHPQNLPCYQFLDLQCPEFYQEHYSAKWLHPIYQSDLSDKFLPGLSKYTTHLQDTYQTRGVRQVLLVRDY